ncbi:hypothetical protein ABZ707_31125 [Streptomyces sp. NPDC006923]|uniref:hypothetical protein n=1 Tax=Streptomyces sp. NPDC006923 TaxID=3155355 RepID=UPI00340DCB33
MSTVAPFGSWHFTTIWDMELLSPPDDPEHCPPSVVWLVMLSGGRHHRLRLFHRRCSPPDSEPL